MPGYTDFYPVRLVPGYELRGEMLNLVNYLKYTLCYVQLDDNYMACMEHGQFLTRGHRTDDIPPESRMLEVWAKVRRGSGCGLDVFKFDWWGNLLIHEKL